MVIAYPKEYDNKEENVLRTLVQSLNNESFVHGVDFGIATQ